MGAETDPGVASAWLAWPDIGAEAVLLAGKAGEGTLCRARTGGWGAWMPSMRSMQVVLLS